MSRGNFTACPGRWEPSGRLLFPAPDDWGTRTAAGGFAPTGRRVFRLKSSGELRSAERGDSPRPAAGAKRKGHLRFPFLFGLLPFPCFLIWRRLPTCDRSEKEYGRGFFLCCGRTTFGVRPLEQHVRSVRYCSATHVVSSTQARHSSAAQLVSLEFADSTYELGVRCNLSSQVLSIITR